MTTLRSSFDHQTAVVRICESFNRMIMGIAPPEFAIKVCQGLENDLEPMILKIFA